MILDPILPEIYTFLDFTRHGVFTNKKKGLNTFSAHLGGDIPKEHPMPYNVYVPVREYLADNKRAIDAVIAYLNEEFQKASYNFSSVKIVPAKITIKKSLGRSHEYPQINVTLSW